MVTYGDYVSKTISSTSKTEVGTITVPSQARRIIGIWTNYTMTPTASKSQFGIVELSGDGVYNASPLKFPLNASDAYAGTLTSDAPNKQTKIIPVDIPVNTKTNITVSVTLADSTSTTVYVGVIFE